MGARLDIITATFSEDIDPKSVTRFSFGVGGGPTNTVVGDLNIKGKVVTFTPNPPLAFGAAYAVKLTTDIQNLAGNFLAEDFIWRFNTGKQLALHSSGNHTCARRVSGELKCWGLNSSGQLGLGDVQNRGDTPNDMGTKLPPVNLGIGRSTVQVVAGTDHTCARLDNLQVKCWGDNSFGELGIGSTTAIGDGPNEMDEDRVAQGNFPPALPRNRT